MCGRQEHGNKPTVLHKTPSLALFTQMTKLYQFSRPHKPKLVILLTLRRDKGGHMTPPLPRRIILNFSEMKIPENFSVTKI